MQKSKTVLTIRNTLIIFGTIVFYCIINNFDYSVTGLYVLFIGDFSIGICPRFLIGSILSLFKDSFTPEWILSFLKIFTAITFLVTSHYVASSVSDIKKEHNNTVTALLALFLLFPFSITIFAGDIFGFIDVFCMFVLLLCAYFAESRILIWTFPLLLCAGVFIHDAYLTAYMTPCLGILAYYVLTKYEKKLWAIISFIASAISTFALLVYRAFFSTAFVKMTEEEAITYLAQKGNCTEEFIAGYIEAFLYGKDVHGFSGIDYADNIFELVKHMIDLTFSQTSTADLFQMLSIIPILTVFFIIWIKAIRNANGFFNKVPYVLFMLTIIPQIASLFISVDVSRFVSTFVIAQFFYLFICLRRKDKNVEIGLDWLKNQPYHLVLPCLSALVFNII